MTERAHAPLAPSASHRWGYCHAAPAYVELLIKSKAILKRVSGEAAQRGSRIHAIAEPVLLARIQDRKPPRMRGAPDEIEEAIAYVDFAMGKLADAGVLGRVRAGVEARATITKICWGSTDLWIYAARCLYILDLKTGRVYVEAEDNTQLILYAIGIIAEELGDEKPREIELAIWQPNGDSDEPARSKTYSYADFLRLAVMMRERIMYASQWFGKSRQELEAGARPGEWCTFCDALGVCPKAKAYAMSISQKNFSPVTLPNKSTKLPDTKDLEPAQLAQILDRAKMFAEWLKAVQERAFELMKMGHDVPGYKVVAKKTRRVWSDKATPATIAKTLGLKLSDVQETILISPAQIEKKIPSKKKELVAGLTFKPFDISLAKTTDKRKAIPSTKISFTPITREETEDDG